MAGCGNADNTTVSGYSGVSLRLLEAHGSASRFLECVVYVSSAAIDA
jgi:hypothetical protein